MDANTDPGTQVADSSSDAPPIGIGIKLLTPVAPDSKDVIDTLSNVNIARKAELQAQADAVTANTAIQNKFQNDQDVLTSDTLKAYDNLKRASSLPPKFASFLGLFDSDYNVNLQQLQIEQNDVKGKQSAAKAKALIDINNQLPALKKTQTEIAQANFKQLADTYAVAKDVSTINLQSAETFAKLNETQQAMIKQRLEAMTLPQAQAELKNAQSGKGDFAALPGLLEKRIDDEQKMDLAHQEAVLALKQHTQSLASGDVDLQKKTFDFLNEKQKYLVGLIPTAVSLPLVQAALKKGAETVTFNAGTKDAYTVPTNLASDAIAERAPKEQATQAMAVANQADQTSQRFDRLTTMAANLAGSDAQGGQEFGLLNSAFQKFDPKDPGAIRDLNTVMNAVEPRLQAVQERVTKQYKTAPAQAAVASFFVNGKFTAPGATAVVHENLGSPGVAASMMFQNAQEALDLAYVNAVSQQAKIGGMPTFTGGEASKNSLLNWMSLQIGKSKDTLDEIKSQVLADPTVTATASAAIDKAYESAAINGTLSDLTKGSTSGVFNQLSKLLESQSADPTNQVHLTADDLRSGKYQGNIGDPSTQKMQWFLEQQSARVKYSVDYNKAFLDALRARAVAAARGNADPAHTMNDSALEANIFGMPHQQASYSGLAQRMLLNANAVSEKMTQAINEDISGSAREKANQADDVVRNASGGYGLTPKQREAIESSENAKLPKAPPTPSATGLPMTSSSFIRQLYSGGR